MDLQEAAARELAKARAAAAVAIVPEESPSTAAVFLNGHWRVNARQLFTAVACAMKASAASVQIAVTGPDPAAIFNLGAALAGAIASAAMALRESMEPLDYVACLVLSESEAPMSVERLHEEMLGFLERTRSGDLAWYLRASERGSDDVLAALQSSDALGELRAVLKKSRCVTWDSTADVFSYKPVHFTWGFWPGA